MCNIKFIYGCKFVDNNYYVMLNFFKDIDP